MLPDYYDGAVKILATATTVEKGDLSKIAVSDQQSFDATVAPVSDGLVADGLTLFGTTLKGSGSVSPIS